MNQDFFNKLFEILQIPETTQEEFRNDLKEIINLNVATSLLTDLPPEKRNSFQALIRSGKADQGSFEKWAKEENVADNQKFLQKLNSVIEKSVQDFFVALTTDLDQQKRKEILEFAGAYIK